ncbi:flavodoxin I [Salirhabdus euzebyi]|uniref:Flavodoxin I n=1 Tax=Salirhabdus euzebyi TaxID=394506 RepID=A0A841PUB0_9BACI|nr:flavodoxin domain-containing protein [Salirhabdus euzebyi]MBB6452439.1 flavodoxin I [Salirhabdus euzebyi]
MRVAIIYSSVTGNTEEVKHLIEKGFSREGITLDTFHMKKDWVPTLSMYDAIIIGTYTWGNGNIPKEMELLYEAFEQQSVHRVVTGVFGTGDSFYPNFCGAVDRFRDMLFVHTKLAVTLKVELFPQSKDNLRVDAFVKRVLAALRLPVVSELQYR